jgi:DNA replication protein DnaC
MKGLDMNRASEIVSRLKLVTSDEPVMRRERDPEQARMEHRRERLRMVGGRIPSRYSGLDFEKAAARAPAIASVNLESLTRSMVVCGATGAGKTTLACAVMRSIIGRAWDGCAEHWRAAKAAWFWVAADLGRELCKAAPWEECRAGELALSASWLCIDDLGTEQGDRAISEISRIISARYNDEQLTVITTAMAWPQIARRYGEGIARRMLESEVIELGGSS